MNENFYDEARESVERESLDKELGGKEWDEEEPKGGYGGAGGFKSVPSKGGVGNYEQTNER